jgi:membrane protease YdiL (CAAX protease family)
MRSIQRFGTARPLPFVILTAVAWIVTAGVAAFIAASVLQTSLADLLPQSLGTMTATACLLVVMRRWGWLRAAGVTALGSRRLWLVTAGLTVFAVAAYELAFFGKIVLPLSTSGSPGAAQVILLRNTVVGIVEEILFRGFLLYALVRVWGNTRRGTLTAVAVPALIFGLTHILQMLAGNPLDDTLMTILNAFVGGLWYGSLVLLGGSLWPAVLIHAATNASVQIGAASLATFDPTVANYAVATAAELPLVIAGLWLLLRKVPASPSAKRREGAGEPSTDVSTMARLLLLLSLTGTFFLAGCAGGADSPPARVPNVTPGIGTTLAAAEPVAVPQGCTVFTVAKGDQVFFGGNDDYINPDSYYWVDPGGAKGYGAIWIGTPDNVQQGVNEKGLAYDANGLPRVDVNPHSERILVSGDYNSYPIHILRECATVEEVIAWASSHRWHSYMHDQMQFADASGDAVIISPGPDGELAFTRKPAGDGFLVSTNFNVANPSHGYGQDSRYETVQRLLGRLVSQEGNLSTQDVASVLDAVHVGGGTSWTIESLLADLPNGVLYLYYFHQFDKPVTLNVAQEIAHPRRPGPLSALFPEDVQREALRRYERIQSSASRCQSWAKAWLVVVLAGLALLGIYSAQTRRRVTFWLPTVTILGPLGLLVWLVAGRRLQPRGWQRTLVEATGDVAPTVVALMIMPVALILVPGALGSDALQVGCIFILPLLVGWLTFQGPLLALLAKRGYLRTLGRRLAHAVVAANLGMGGIFAIGMPLISKSASICPILPLSLSTVVLWWAIAVLGALAGGLVLWLFETWAVQRGFQAWSVLTSGEGEARFASWRKLRGWVLLSYVALVGGVVLSTFLQRLLSA